MKTKFQTEDGYVLSWDARTRRWTDGDLEFKADENGLPVDDAGERLDGGMLFELDKKKRRATP